MESLSVFRVQDRISKTEKLSTSSPLSCENFAELSKCCWQKIKYKRQLTQVTARKFFILQVCFQLRFDSFLKNGSTDNPRLGAILGGRRPVLHLLQRRERRDEVRLGLRLPLPSLAKVQGTKDGWNERRRRTKRGSRSRRLKTEAEKDEMNFWTRVLKKSTHF